MEFNLIIFAQKVREMRTAQTDYFRTRSPLYLSKSKELEKEVDGLVRLALGAPPEPPKTVQNNLFNG